MELTSKSSTSWNIHRDSQSNARKYNIFSSRLYSVTLDKVDSSSENESTSNADVGEPFFEGELVSFITANDGISVAAMKVRDDEIINSGFSASDTSTSTNMFGGAQIPSSAKSASKKNTGGQGDDLVGRKVSFSDSSGESKTGIVVAQRHPVAFVLCNFDSIDKETATVSIFQSKSKINVSQNLIGKVVDCFGEEISKKERSDNISDTTKDNIGKAIFAVIPKVDEISVINAPLLTGITAIDVLTPIGKGQNMLLIGNNKETRRNIILDMLSTQTKEGTKCVYACTSTDDETRLSTLSRLRDTNLSDKIVTVCTRENLDSTCSATAAAEAVTVASSACSIAESYARDSGEDSLVIIDVLDYHKDLWDSTTRTLVDLYGADSVVQGDLSGSASSEMRGFYSGLIQRSAKFNKAKGGGSLTLILVCSIPEEDTSDEDIVYQPEDFDLTSQKVKERVAKLVEAKIPLTATTLRKIQIPVPSGNEQSNKFRLSMQHVDDLISMSDGQIWLGPREKDSTQLILDVQRSITRVGIGADTKSRADAPALQALTGGIRFELAQSFDALENSSNKADLKSITKRDAWLLAMYQEPGTQRTLSEQCVVLLAVKLGVLDDVVNNKTKDEGVQVVQKMIEHVWDTAGDEMKGIDETLDFLSSESISKLENAINTFFK